MKNYLLLVLLCTSINSFAQNFYFPKQYYADSATMEKNIPAVAKQVLQLYKNTDRVSYYDEVFRYQIAADQYQDAANSIDSLRALLGASDSTGTKGIGFQYYSFALAKVQQSEKQVSFTDAYTIVFTTLFNNLSESASATASGYFSSDAQKQRNALQKILSGLTAKDSISIDDAKTLCRAYTAYTVYSQVTPIALPVLAERENRLFIIEDSVLIKTRDGATIAATVVRKRGITTKQPVVFVFNIYNSPRDKARAKEAAINGYTGVVANTRGKRLSPEDIEPFEHDANDAYDIIDWISKQPWSNGKVGMFGGSYLGFSQWAAVKKLHPALKTIVPQVAVGIGIDYPLQNSVFMSYMLRWIHYVTNSKETDEADFGNNAHWDSVFKKWYVSGKAFRSLDSIEGRGNKIFQRWLQHPANDAYWQNMVAYKNDFANINIPVLTTTGFFDPDQLGAMYYFKQHHLYNKNATHYLLIGPYDHAGAQSAASSVVNGYQIDSVANISITKLAYKWFDYILKDSARPAILQDRVNYQVMGTNEWKHVPSLSKMNNDTLTFYLSNVRAAQHYKLDTQPAATPEYIRQEVDFSYRGDSAGNTGDGGIIDSTLDVTNGLSFITAPFTRPFEINGSFIGEITAAINKKDIDVNMALYEQMPGGKYFSLSTALLRASYAKNRSRRQLLQPGNIEKIPVNNTYFTSRKISAGSRLIIVLSVNKNPYWQINYGTGKDVSDETIADGVVPLQIKWYNNSYIKIPVMK